MSTPCKNTRSSIRPGVSQSQRVLDAVLPGFVSVDEREYPDLVLFASRYAAFLNYYNRNNTVEGDWKPFMLMDVSVTLATLTRLDIQEYLTYAKDIYDRIEASPVTGEADLKKYFKTIFDLCFSITVLLDRYYRALPEDFEFKEVLGSAVRSHLPEYLDRLEKYYEEALNQGLVDPSGTFLFDDRPPELIFSQDFRAGDLSGDIWENTDPVPFSPSFHGATVVAKIKNTASHNLFTAITEQYLKILTRVVEAAPGYLDRTLSGFPTHSPHYALFLTFIKLFRVSQDSLNGFTKRHLDFYYREVLRLTKKVPEPDTVHLLFELSKTAGTGILLERGTVFKAGKDRDGQELFYGLKEQTLLGKGKVAALKNIFGYDLDAAAAGPAGGGILASPAFSGVPLRRISAGTVANSGDGAGAPLLYPDKSWNAFGEAGRAAGRSGFGIASDYLFLAGGTRNITFTFQLHEGSLTLSPVALEKIFTIDLSAEKGWYRVPAEAQAVAVAADRTSFSLSIRLEGGDPSVVPCSPEVHGYQFERALPTALFTLADGTAPEELWNLQISAVTLDVSVDGFKSLFIENDDGNLNPAKPFDIFGALPHKGSAFILGCKELFMKTRRPLGGKLSAELLLTWDDHQALKTTLEANPQLTVHYLKDARWEADMLSPPQTLFDVSGGDPAAATLLKFYLPRQDIETDFTPGGHYATDSKWGFLKLVLGGDFGHDDYARRLAESIRVTSIEDKEAGTTTTSIDVGEVPEPCTPRVKEITLKYRAGTELDLSDPAEGNFIHLSPFGYTGIPGGAFPGKLLPQFQDEGELLIGLEELQTGQTLSLLFQVAEGTADPLAKKQEINWHYLKAGNQWEGFRKEEIADATGGLLTSGIIKFSIPSDAARGGTLMGDELHWLKASIAGNSRAVPRLITVTAQAAAAQFLDYKRTGNYFKEALPAGAISKLLTGNPAIKTIRQPYASFGGRTLEDDVSWYRWISERLRHKQRAVTPWDYERLVLEAFPAVYKVKCISHSRARTNNELSPGCVTVVPVPDLHGRNAFDPLRPRASLGLLEDIRKFLSGIVSSHLELEVCNPLFEEIQLEFNVRYHNDDVDFFTRQLRAELEQFLAPWAFDAGSDIEFGSRVSKSTLINFIEERPYVDSLSGVKMYRIGQDGRRSNDLEEAVATSSRSVLVSVKAEDPVYAHLINEKVCTC